MKTIINTNKYLSTELIEKCFEKNKSLNIDKRITGNGFTTGFADLKPAFGKVNVLVAPNQSVVTDKENDYNAGNFGKGKRIAFVLENQGLRGYAKDYDLIVLVADSFVNFSYKLEGNIDKLVIDEIHTTHSQSGFRYKLSKFLKILKANYNSHCDIAYITATPNKYWHPDIVIENTKMLHQDVYLSNDINKTIERVAQKFNDGERCLIFTNEADVVYNIMAKCKSNSIAIGSGVNFLTTLLSKVEVDINKDSLLQIHSSKNFEGWSDQSIESNVFFFSNIAIVHAAFLPSNIIQALGRTRNGFKYSEICIREKSRLGFKFSKTLKEHDILKMIERLINVKTSVEKKMSKTHSFRYQGEVINTRVLDPFIYYRYDQEKISMEVNHDYLNIFKEQIDLTRSLESSYFSDRGLNVIKLNDKMKSTLRVISIKGELKMNVIANNISNNDKHDIINEFFFSKRPNEDLSNSKTRDFYATEVSNMIDVAARTNTKIPSRWINLLDILTDPNLYSELAKINTERKIKKGESAREIRKSKKSFKKVGFKKSLQVAINIVREKITHNIVAHRDYNEYTAVSIRIIEYFAKRLDLSVTEYDIKTAYPRILYSICGLELNETFYGQNKKLKISANAIINDLWYDKKKSTPLYKQKQNAIRRLQAVNFDNTVIDYLMTNWFETQYKGDIFNFLAYNESKIIKDVQRRMIDYNANDPSAFVFRRHDSFLYFNDGIMEPIDQFLPIFKYNNIGGFF